MESGVGPWRGGWDDNNSWSPFSDVWDHPWNYGSGSNYDVVRRSGRSEAVDSASAIAHPHLDWRETHTAHVFRAHLPGVRKEDLKVQVENNNILQISGERMKEQEDQNDKWHPVERQCGSFVRRFRLPENANVDHIGCSLEHGVLTVTVPKKETLPQSKNVRQINVA